MTDSGNDPQNQSTDQGNKPSEPKRKVAKTLLEFSFPGSKEQSPAGSPQDQQQATGSGASSGRRVAKTMLFQSPVAPEPPSPPGASRRVAKTLLCRSPLAPEQQVVPTQSNQFPKIKRTLGDLAKVDTPRASVENFTRITEAEPKRVTHRTPVNRTMLDYSIMEKISEGAAVKDQARAVEQQKVKESEPVKETVPIVARKSELKCPWTWPDDASGAKFRYCGKCQYPVYDFQGMDRHEAEVTIFVRENRTKAPLFERADGKFMTRECTVALRQKSNLVLMCIILVASVAAVLVVMVPMALMQKPSAPVATNQSETGTVSSPPSATGLSPPSQPAPSPVPSTAAAPQSALPGQQSPPGVSNQTGIDSTPKVVTTKNGITVDFSDLDAPAQAPAH